MPNLDHRPGDKHTPATRQECAAIYAAHGSLRKASDLTGVNYKTLWHWHKHDPEWLDEVRTLQSQKQQEHRARYVEIVSLAQERTIEALPEATAAQASIIAATATDKVRVIDGMPTSIRGESESIASLANEFRRIARDNKNIMDSVISTQVPESEE